MGAAEMSLGIERLNFVKLRALHDVALEVNDDDLQNFVEEMLDDQVGMALRALCFRDSNAIIHDCTLPFLCLWRWCVCGRSWTRMWTRVEDSGFGPSGLSCTG